VLWLPLCPLPRRAGPPAHLRWRLNTAVVAAGLWAIVCPCAHDECTNWGLRWAAASNGTALLPLPARARKFHGGSAALLRPRSQHCGTVGQGHRGVGSVDCCVTCGRHGGASAASSGDVPPLLLSAVSFSVDAVQRACGARKTVRRRCRLVISDRDGLAPSDAALAARGTHVEQFNGLIIAKFRRRARSKLNVSTHRYV